ncbi:hypothetical protein PUN4_770056 [Paraburkholderia unamae]|nr:hypothetical protein PUN4_770056 [Paraburkholderia unamae]
MLDKAWWGVFLGAAGCPKGQFGGETGIRTPDRLLTYTRFPGVRLKPLIHLSGGRRIIAESWRRRKAITPNLARLALSKVSRTP